MIDLLAKSCEYCVAADKRVSVFQVLASRAIEKDISAVQWHRKRGQQYHGKVEALLTAMQGAGLPLY